MTTSFTFPPISINCDCGESFGGGIWSVGTDDELIMPIIDAANIACGFHAGDYTTMRKSVQLAKQHNVAVGAHPGFPDLTGFGRREMKVTPEELHNIVLYQVGALKAFLELEGAQLTHVKPHGALYGLCSRSLDHAVSVARVAKQYNVPLTGLLDTAHSQSAEMVGVPFVAEWFADLEYDREGKLIITARHGKTDLDQVRERATALLEKGTITTNAGTTLHIFGKGGSRPPLSMCLHSDTPGAEKLAEVLRDVIKKHPNPTFGL